jgi:hexosaminidase
MNLEIEPMLWGYMEDVRSYFSNDLYVKYGKVFEKIWIASAYKGASGELAVITSIEHHYRNHISWLEIMQEKTSQKILRFKGIAITGWSRYDHFLALCDLLPEATPSLVFNLRVMQTGPLNDAIKGEITRDLGCIGQLPWNGKDVYGSVRCEFPGHEVYEAILPIENVLRSYKDTMEFADKYMSPLNLRYGYLHKMRALEVMSKLNFEYISMNAFKDNFIKACNEMYWEDTAKEWLLVYFIPQLDRVYDLMVKIRELTPQSDWKPRPHPVTLRTYPGLT